MQMVDNVDLIKPHSATSNSPEVFNQIYWQGFEAWNGQSAPNFLVKNGTVLTPKDL
jgi:hypothetical protein